MVVATVELKSLLEARNKAVEKCRQTKEKAEKEGKWSAEDREVFNKAKEEAIQSKKEYDIALADQRNSEWLEGADKDDETPASRVTDPTEHGGGSGDEKPRSIIWNSADPAVTAMNHSMRRGYRHANRRIDLAGARGSSEYHSSFNNYLRGQTPTRAFSKFKPETYLQQRSDVEEVGGYLVASEEFAAGMLKEIDDQTFIQRLSRVFIVRQAKSLGIRKRLSKVNGIRKGSEIGNITDGTPSSQRWGKRNLTPYYFTGWTRISRDLIRNATMDVESIVREEIGLDASETNEVEFLTGNGQEGPLGVLVNSTEGISSARDVSALDADVGGLDEAGDGTTKFGFNTMIRAKYALKKRYRETGRWMFHRDRVADIAQIRDESGQYIWQPSKTVGDPDMALGIAIDESEWMPSTAAAGLYFGLLANWQYYGIAYGLEWEFLRLQEIAARTNEIEYHFRYTLDAMPLLEEAFVRLKYADS